MLVYRVCCRDEINKIFQNDSFSTIGSLGEDFIKYQEAKDINNHKYDPQKRYLHFFGDIWSILYWKALKGNYVCTYDISDDILTNCVGVGKYLNPGSESDNRSCVSEYVVESEKIKKEYLIRVELITTDIDFTDDDYPEALDDYLEIIFERKPKEYQYRIKTISEEEIKQLLKELGGIKS